MCCIRGSEVRARKAVAILRERSYSHGYGHRYGHRYQILPMRLHPESGARLLRLGRV
jgi:hypothetical protein